MSQQLDPDQLAWMQEKGLQMSMTLVPDKRRIATRDKPPGVDDSQVQLFIRIQTGTDHQIIHSDFVPNTRGDINKLLKAQFDIARKNLLDQRFNPGPTAGPGEIGG